MLGWLVIPLSKKILLAKRGGVSLAYHFYGPCFDMWFSSFTSGSIYNWSFIPHTTYHLFYSIIYHVNCIEPLCSWLRFWSNTSPCVLDESGQITSNYYNSLSWNKAIQGDDFPSFHQWFPGFGRDVRSWWNLPRISWARCCRLSLCTFARCSLKLSTLLLCT